MQKNTNAVNRKNYIYSDFFKDNDSAVEQKVKFKYFNSDKDIFESLDIKFIKKPDYNRCKWFWKSTLLGLIAGVLYPQSGSTANTSRIGYIGAVPLILTDSSEQMFMVIN